MAAFRLKVLRATKIVGLAVQFRRLTDIVMPEGMPHGVSLALIARRYVQDVEVLFMTGHQHVLETVGELPGKAFVKPVDLSELTQEIRRRLSA